MPNMEIFYGSGAHDGYVSLDLIDDQLVLEVAGTEINFRNARQVVISEDQLRQMLTNYDNLKSA